MSKSKLDKFSENKDFACVVEPGILPITDGIYDLKGKWSQTVFGNNNPVVLELGCGRGDYSIGLQALNPLKNYVGVDIKGCRIWNGAKYIIDNNIRGIRFLRTRLEKIDLFFGESEVDEIWLPFPDPRPKNSEMSKRSVSPVFLKRYSKILINGGSVNLKTDSTLLFKYATNILKANSVTPVLYSEDIYSSKKKLPPEITEIQTKYEERFVAEGKKIMFMRFLLYKDRDYADPYS